MALKDGNILVSQTFFLLRVQSSSRNWVFSENNARFLVVDIAVSYLN